MTAGAPSTSGLAVVVGAGGALGAALLAQLQHEGPYDRVLGLGRAGEIRIDYADEASIAAAAQAVANMCAESGLALRLLLVATGFLHGAQGQPERSWRHLDAGYLQQVFLVNTFGPALLIKHFFPLLPRQGRCVAGFVSARVGSISDNALGGWYGYRASKAALNQLVKTAAIELTRNNSESICVALHPGTVNTPLSQPFAKSGLTVRPPQEAAGDLLAVLAGLAPADTGALVDYRGQTLPF
ncbi:MAG: SDR family NAD(P)-dependent oxidoreductase [Polaromonas sp.]|uniref:SDR family NAD(P)-dependent oxidoreductase n=1 Tax=Polaromonas sp. TaxID=1869339 RepID=UPI002488416A|nr:SDR family NAD(P)-dependent oxidoreductase [Polaromonas sp.]MDI1269785.1 SDR family NAD(P)-dependent oxidoreductase [Polaromonas sp.]